MLILCKAAGLSWPTVKAVITVRPDGKAPSSQGLDAAFANYGRLSASTAQRVVRFWQVSRSQYIAVPLQRLRKIRKHDARSSRAALAW